MGAVTAGHRRQAGHTGLARTSRPRVRSRVPAVLGRSMPIVIGTSASEGLLRDGGLQPSVTPAISPKLLRGCLLVVKLHKS